MGLKERLNDDDLARADYMSAAHLHRYAVAAELCGGLRVLDLACGTGYGSEILAARAASVHGVDIDVASIEHARNTRVRDGLRFSASDALEFLRASGSEDFEVIVMFEGLEHVPDAEAVLDEFERLSLAGTRLIVSVPNSRAFREDNPFHLTDFGYAESRAAFRRFGDVTMLYQVLAEGSVILADHADGHDFRGRVGALEQAEPEYANAFIAVIGFGADAAQHVTAELNLMATPSHNRYMVELERANTAYFRTNRQLARGIYGKHDAAAAIVVARVEALERALQQERAWRDATRYRAVDRVVAGVRRVPGLYALLRFVRRCLGRGRSMPSNPGAETPHRV